MLSSGHKPDAGPDGVTVERVLSNGKRVYLHSFKLGLVEQCLRPGVSVAGVALAHGINANLLRKWICKHGAPRAPHPTVLLPVTIDAAVPAASLQRAPPAIAPSASPDSAGPIEIDVFGACVTLRGEVDARRLRLVLDVLAQRA